MKKSIIATSVIVVLGVSYTMASWYTGNIIEKNFDKTFNKFTQNINVQKELYDLNPSNINIKYDNYQKGIFSTSINIKVDIMATENSDGSSIFDDTVTIYHGPFPWSQIKSANFSPKAADIYYETTKESNPQLWVAASNKPFINMHSVIDYSENINIEISNQPAKYIDEKGSFEWETTANKLSISTGSDINTLNYGGAIERLEYKNFFTNIVVAKNLSLSGEFSLKKNGGDYALAQYFTIENLAFGPKEDNTFEINQLTVESNNVKQNEQTTRETSASINNLTFGKQNLGRGEMLLSYNTSTKSDQSTTQNDAFAIKNLVIKLDKLLWQTSQGDLDANFVVDIEGDPFKFDQLDEDNVNFMEINANLPLNTLTYLVAQISNPNKNASDEDGIIKAKKNILLLSGLYAMAFPMIDVQYDTGNDTKDGIFVELYYSKDEKRAKLKDQEVTIGEFWQALSRNRLQF